jgi:hypothetical protein
LPCEVKDSPEALATTDAFAGTAAIKVARAETGSGAAAEIGAMTAETGAATIVGANGRTDALGRPMTADVLTVAAETVPRIGVGATRTEATLAEARDANKAEQRRIVFIMRKSTNTTRRSSWAKGPERAAEMGLTPSKSQARRPEPARSGDVFAKY